MDYPEKELELRERLHAEPHLCVACDEIARSQERFKGGGKPAHLGVFHVLRDVERAPLNGEEPGATYPEGGPG